MDSDAQLAQYFAGMWPHLDEHARRLFAASEAVELGYGGISLVSRACGLSRVTITKGVEELQAPPLAARPGSSRGRRATRVDVQRSRLGARVGGAGRAHGAWRPGVAAAVDLQEHAYACGRADGPAPSGQPHQSRPNPAGGWLQPAGQPQDRGRGRSSGSRRAVPVYQQQVRKRASRAGGP